MIKNAAVVLTFISALFFPWPFSVTLALALAFFEPWIPLAIGILIDTLYFVPQDGAVPLFLFGGVLATLCALFVRSRLKTSIIME